MPQLEKIWENTNGEIPAAYDREIIGLTGGVIFLLDDKTYIRVDCDQEPKSCRCHSKGGECHAQNCFVLDGGEFSPAAFQTMCGKDVRLTDLVEQLKDQMDDLSDDAIIF